MSRVCILYTITFTAVTEKDRVLSLLDTVLQRKDDGSLDHDLQKPAHPVSYLDFNTIHPT